MVSLYILVAIETCVMSGQIILGTRLFYMLTSIAYLTQTYPYFCYVGIIYHFPPYIQYPSILIPTLDLNLNQ